MCVLSHKGYHKLCLKVCELTLLQSKSKHMYCSIFSHFLIRLLLSWLCYHLSFSHPFFILQSRNSTPPRGEYNVYSTFQSHEPEFDYLKSLEIEEKINKIKWLPRQNHAHFLLSTNGEYTGWSLNLVHWDVFFWWQMTQVTQQGEIIKTYYNYQYTAVTTCKNTCADALWFFK